MTNTLTPRQKLETALAINRGIEFVENYKPAKTSHTGGMKGRELAQLYFDIHTALYQDIHGSQGEANSADRVSDRTGSGSIKDLINYHAATLFDENGAFKPMPKERINTDLSKALAHTYKEITQINPPPFTYGNELTTRVLFSVIGRMPAFKETYGKTIDFRNIDAQDVKTLTDKASNVEALTSVFRHAMDESRTPVLPKVENFKSWQDNSTTIEGLRFLEVKKGGISHLVTANGGLVQRNKIEAELQRHLRTPEKVVGDFRVKREDIRDYLLDDLSGKERIDGVDVKDSAPLICMSTNSITGLSDKNHKRLLDFLKAQGKTGDVLFQLADPNIAQSMVAAAESTSPEMKHIVEVAADRVHHLRDIIDAEKEKLFEGKETAAGRGQKPKLFVSMGGSATGKTSVTELANTATDGNFVEASLDKAREVFDVYKVLRAVGHHADDYVAVEDMAKTLREWTKDKAIGDGYNLLYDGSGIPYKGSYSKIAEQAKNKRYQVTVGAADCMLALPEQRQEEFTDNAIDRAIHRAEKEKRALPWNVTVGKHIGFSSALLDAFEDKNVGKILLDDRAGPKGFAYNMAESFEVDTATATRLVEARKAGHLLDELKKDEGKLLPSNPGKKAENLPPITEDNVDIIHKVVAGKHRVLVINNVQRFIDLVQKGQQNQYAQGPDNLTHMHGGLSFHIPDIDTPNGDGTPHKEGHLRLNNPPEEYKKGYADRYKREETDKAGPKR